MATIHRDNVGNIDVIERVISEFAKTNACRVGWVDDHVPHRPDYPDWVLTGGGRGQIQIVPNIYMGSIGIWIHPFTSSGGRLLKPRCARGVLNSNSTAAYVERALKEELAAAAEALGWNAE